MDDITEGEMNMAMTRVGYRNAKQSVLMKPAGEPDHSISYPVLSRVIEVYTEKCLRNATTTAAMNALLAHLGIPELESTTSDKDQEYFVSVVLKGLLAGIMLQIVCQGFAVWTLAPPPKKDLHGADGADQQTTFPVPVLVDSSSHDFFVVVNTRTRSKHMVGFRKDVMGGMYNSSGGEAALPTFMGAGGGGRGAGGRDKGAAGSNRKPDPRLHFFIYKWPSRYGEPRCHMASVWESFVHCDILTAADTRAALQRATPVTFLEASTAGDQQAVRSDMLGGLDEIDLYRQARAQRNVAALASSAMSDLQTTMHHRAGQAAAAPGLAEATAGLIPIPPMYKISSVAPKVEQPKNMMEVLRRCQEDISAVFGVPSSLLNQRTGGGGRAQSSDVEKVAMQMRNAVAETKGWMIPIVSRMFESTVVAAREEARRTVGAKAIAAGSAVYMSTSAAIELYNAKVRRLIVAARAKKKKKKKDEDEDEEEVPEEISEEAAIATKETRAKSAMDTARPRLEELATGEFRIVFPASDRSSEVGVEKETREREHLIKMETLQHKHLVKMETIHHQHELEKLKLKLQMEAEMKLNEFKHAKQMEEMATATATAAAATETKKPMVDTGKETPAKPTTTDTGAKKKTPTADHHHVSGGGDDDMPKGVTSDMTNAEGEVSGKPVSMQKKRAKVPGGDLSPEAKKRVRVS